MSRIGSLPIELPQDVSVQVTGKTVVVKGLKGEVRCDVPAAITVKQNGQLLEVSRKSDEPDHRALHGLVRAQLKNAIAGVTRGFSKTLELTGVGYRASLSGPNLILTLGFSHPVRVTPPQGITISVSEGNIIVSGVDKQLVGQVAANIRSRKKPEPYKGKGIKYRGEHIRKKAGKSAKVIGGLSAAAGGK